MKLGRIVALWRETLAPQASLAALGRRLGIEVRLGQPRPVTKLGTEN